MKQKELLLAAFGIEAALCARRESFTHFFRNGSQRTWVVEVFENHVCVTVDVGGSSPHCIELVEEYNIWREEVHRTLLELLPFPYIGSLSVGDDVWKVTISPELLRLHEFPPF